MPPEVAIAVEAPRWKLKSDGPETTPTGLYSASMWRASSGGTMTGSSPAILALMGGLKEQWLREEGAFDLAGEFDAAITLILP